MAELSIEERLDRQPIGSEPELVVCKSFDYYSNIPPRRIIEINDTQSLALGFLSVTGAAGGTGKSSLASVEELCLATGRDLFVHSKPALRCGRKRVWSMSLEDDEEEHRRRVTAVMRHYAVNPEDVGDYYRVTYKHDSPIEIGRVDRYSGFIVSPQAERIKQIVLEQRIDVIYIDPFVNTHQIPENDNGAMNKVADVWRSIAQECGVAIMLTHHIRKTGGGHEVGAEDLRGAVSLVSAARLVRVLAPMSQEEAKSFSIDDHQRRFYFWVNPTAKANIAPPSTSRVWYHMASVNLRNGTDEWDDDRIGVVEAWEVPDSLDSVTVKHVEELSRRMINATNEYLLEYCRDNIQAEGWIGKLIAEIVGLNCEDVADKSKLKRIIKEWVRVKVLEKIEVVNPKDRKLKKCFKAGIGLQPLVINL